MTSIAFNLAKGMGKPLPPESAQVMKLALLIQLNFRQQRVTG